MFISHATRPFLEPGDPFFLQASGFALLFRLATMLEGGHIPFVAPSYSQNGEIGATATRQSGRFRMMPVIVGRPSVASVASAIRVRKRRSGFFGLRIPHLHRVWEYSNDRNK